MSLNLCKIHLFLAMFALALSFSASIALSVVALSRVPFSLVPFFQVFVLGVSMSSDFFAFNALSVRLLYMHCHL